MYVLMVLATAAFAEDALPVKVRLTHVAADSWRADFEFSQPVDAMRFEPVGEFRQSSWKVLTPGLTLTTGGEHEVLSSVDGKSLQKASVQLTTYDQIVEKQYIAIDRFSDGGRLFYLGFLQGQVQQGHAMRQIDADYTLVGFGGENVLGPDTQAISSGAVSSYAYFGPQKPVKAGEAMVLLDPAISDWARETLLDTTIRISTYYGAAYQQQLRHPALVMVATNSISAPGLSFKGGVVGTRIVYRLGGDASRSADHPRKREIISQLVAHEMAHLWQNNVRRGGIAEETPPWIYEGGAEAMSLDGLRGSGIWTAEQVRAFTETTLRECALLGHRLDSYRGFYACGFERYHQLKAGVVPVWRAMMIAADRAGEYYNETQVDRLGSLDVPRTP